MTKSHTARIVVKIEQETDKAVRVSADVYRGDDALAASAWLPKSQIKISEIPGRGTKEFDLSIYTTIIDLPGWLFCRIQKETGAEWHDVSEAAKARRLAEIAG